MSKIAEVSLETFVDDDRNANKGTERGRGMLGKSIAELGAGRSIVVDKNNRIIAGNKTRQAMVEAGIGKAIVVETNGHELVVVKRNDLDLSERKGKARRLAYLDNRVGEVDLEWADDVLADDMEAGFDFDGIFSDGELLDMISEEGSDGEGDGEEAAHGALAERFGVPPFSVLDAKSGEWQKRKRYWGAMLPGLNTSAGRDDELLMRGGDDFLGKKMGNMGTTSVFDPVLAELLVGWFTNVGDVVVDPFAGGPVRGMVTGLLGREYIGVDIRKEQIDENEAMLAGAVEGLPPMARPRWLLGDSQNIDAMVEGRECDMVFSCPPYFDIEVYSQNEGDISNTASYDAFMAAYATIIAKACSLLRDGGFAAFVVGDIRDKQGNFCGFVGDTVRAFEAAGLRLYNDAVYLQSIGTAALRSRQFTLSRKLVKTHQNVLVFVKGKPRKLDDVKLPVIDDDVEELEPDDME